jgi:hypothetical protein
MKDEPSNINWQNTNYPNYKKCCRTFIALLIGILIICVSFGVAIATKYANDALSAEFNINIDCTFVEYTVDQIKTEYESDIPLQNKVLTYCFCLNTLYNDGYQATSGYKFPNTTTTPCSDWLSSYFKYNSINMLLIATIPLINIFLSGFLRAVTSFEKNKTLTEDMMSNMWKIFTLQFINTCLVIILVNMYIEPVANWSKQFPLFTGQYADFEPGWYSNVGVTLVSVGYLMYRFLRCF